MIRTLETLELVGNAACLDFVNTVNSWIDTEYDYLQDYSTWVAWAEHAGVLNKAQARALQRTAATEGRAASKVFQEALRQRILFHNVFDKLASGQKPQQRDFAQLNQLHARGIAAATLKARSKNFTFDWIHSQNLATPLFVIAHSAIELLVSADLIRLKACPNCGWLFHDTSKNGLRRWCSMNTCGSRDKMKRYYRRGKSL